MSEFNNPEDLKYKIEQEAYYLSEKKLSYEELCLIFAEESIQSEREIPGRISKFKIEEKSKEIFDLSYSNDEICWKIAELRVKMNK